MNRPEDAKPVRQPSWLQPSALTADDYTRLSKEELLTHVHQLGRQLEECTAGWRELNGDLELFGTSVAHDLRAPLRVMRGFADVLLHDVGPRLNEEERGNLQRIVNNAARLERILHHLVTYARLGRTEVVLAPLDLKELIEDFVSAQRSRGGEPGQFTLHGPSVRVLAQASGLIEALEQLTDNARKFVAAGVTPAISLRIEPLDRTARLWVEDNGIGISPSYHDRIFTLFERLHRDRYEGTGAGLAITKRRIQRMGGQIGVESEDNHGSRFWIELPRAE